MRYKSKIEIIKGGAMEMEHSFFPHHIKIMKVALVGMVCVCVCVRAMPVSICAMNVTQTKCFGPRTFFRYKS